MRFLKLFFITILLLPAAARAQIPQIPVQQASVPAGSYQGLNFVAGCTIGPKVNNYAQITCGGGGGGGTVTSVTCGAGLACTPANPINTSGTVALVAPTSSVLGGVTGCTGASCSGSPALTCAAGNAATGFSVAGVMQCSAFGSGSVTSVTCGSGLTCTATNPFTAAGTIALTTPACALTGCSMSGAITLNPAANAILASSAAALGGPNTSSSNTVPSAVSSYENTTAALVGQTQDSWSEEFIGRGWETSGGTSQTVSGKFYLNPINAATNMPAFNIALKQSTAGSYINVLSFGTNSLGSTAEINPIGNSTNLNIGSNGNANNVANMLLSSNSIQFATNTFANTLATINTTGLFPEDGTRLLGTSGGRWKRIYAGGTATTSGQWALGAGWGNTAAVGTITGNDTKMRFTITTGGTGIALDPTWVYTWKDGTWTTAPTCTTLLKTTSDATVSTSPIINDVSIAATNTVTVGAGVGLTPLTGQTYTFQTTCEGGN